jgi:hypothetical protein
MTGTGIWHAAENSYNKELPANEARKRVLTKDKQSENKAKATQQSEQ